MKMEKMFDKKRIGIVLTVFLFVSFLSVGVFAEEENVSEALVINYFYQVRCPHCTNQAIFLESLKEKYPSIIVEKYDITSRNSLEKLDLLSEEYGVEIDRIVTPMTFVGGKFFRGYNEGIGNSIEEVVLEKLGEPKEPIGENGNGTDDEENITVLPFIGSIDLNGYSLPIITIIISSLDGMNVCSIGALILILAIVIKFNSRKKILLFGGLFILTSATVYGILVFVWYGLIRSLITYFTILNLIIGLAGIFGGIYFFKKFLLFYKYGPSCEVKTNKYVTRIQERVMLVVGDSNKGFFSVAAILMAFAIIVTLVELPCSFALPLVFSGILADAGLSHLSSFFYILIYLFFYMLIEIIIFLTAVYTKEVWYGPEKAIIWVTFIASLIMFAFGLYYIYPMLPF